MLQTVESRPLHPVIPERAAEFVKAARSENTKRAYRAAWTSFTAFCEARGVATLPANPATIADYITHLAESGRRPSTIGGACSAIGSAHRMAGLPDPSQNESVKLLLSGIRRKLGTAPAQKAPITRAELARMVDGLGDGLGGKRDRALLLLGYAGAFRRSELISLNVGDLHFTAHGVKMSLQRSKTDQEGEGTLKHAPALKEENLCPVTALRAWLDAADIRRGPLFRKVDRWGHVQAGRLNDRAVALIVKRAAEGAGLEPRQFAGHSLRAGFATQAAADGVDTLAIREVTGHKSDKMLARYVRSGGRLAREAVRRALGE